jgi:hypothetical protein
VSVDGISRRNDWPRLVDVGRVEPTGSDRAALRKAAAKPKPPIEGLMVPDSPLPPRECAIISKLDYARRRRVRELAEKEQWHALSRDHPFGVIGSGKRFMRGHPIAEEYRCHA